MSIENEASQLGRDTIPEGWKIKELRSISKTPMQNGVFFKPELKGTGSRIVNVGDLYSSVPINPDSLERFAATSAEKERFKVEGGDIFFTRSSVVPSGIAHCNIFDSIGDESVVFDSHVIRFRPDIKVVNPHYLFRYCTASIARNYLVSHAKTGTMTTIDQGVLGKCPVLLPPSSEQEAIAEALSDADGLIESLEQLIDKKRQIKQGAMQELLTGKRRLFKENKTKGTKATLLGDLPEDWAITTLKTICSFENGDRGVNYPSKSDFKMSGIPFVNAGHLGDKKIALNEMDYITTEKYEQLGGGKFKYGDVLFCLRGSLGKFAVVKEQGLAGAIASSLIIIRPQKSMLDADFFGFYLESVHCQKMIDLFAGGAAQPNLGGQDLGKFYIALPPTKDEQAAIATILSDMDAEITGLETKLTKARKVKQGMMQELLTGRIRLV